MTTSRLLSCAALTSFSIAASMAVAGCSSVDTAASTAGGAAAATGSFDAVYTNTLSKNCSGCHAPGAPGYAAGSTESSLDFATADKAFSTLQGSAAGLKGNFSSCNAVAFVTAGDPSKSLLMAAIDSTTRRGFVSGMCNQDTVSAMEARGGALSPSQVSEVRAWITAGAKR